MTDYERVWLKPVGDKDNPVCEEEDCSAERKNLHFSKRRPSGVCIGDTIIQYGVGIRMVMACYTVLSEPMEIPEEERDEPWKCRWPWYVQGCNQTRCFGRAWWEHSLYLGALVETYHAEQGDTAPVTYVGGLTLKAFQFGADKVHLFPDFARFTLEQIEQCRRL